MPKRQPSRDTVNIAIAGNPFSDAVYRHHNDVDSAMLAQSTYHPDVQTNPNPSRTVQFTDRTPQIGVLPSEADDPILPTQFPGGLRSSDKAALYGSMATNYVQAASKDIIQTRDAYVMASLSDLQTQLNTGRRFIPGSVLTEEAEAIPRSKGSSEIDKMNRKKYYDSKQYYLNFLPTMQVLDNGRTNRENLRRQPLNNIGIEGKWSVEDNEIKQQIAEIQATEGSSLGHYGGMNKLQPIENIFQ